MTWQWEIAELIMLCNEFLTVLNSSEIKQTLKKLDGIIADQDQKKSAIFENVSTIDDVHTAINRVNLRIYGLKLTLNGLARDSSEALEAQASFTNVAEVVRQELEKLFHEDLRDLNQEVGAAVESLDKVRTDMERCFNAPAEPLSNRENVLRWDVAIAGIGLSPLISNLFYYYMSPVTPNKTTIGSMIYSCLKTTAGFLSSFGLRVDDPQSSLTIVPTEYPFSTSVVIAGISVSVTFTGYTIIQHIKRQWSAPVSTASVLNEDLPTQCYSSSRRERAVGRAGAGIDFVREFHASATIMKKFNESISKAILLKNMICDRIDTIERNQVAIMNNDENELKAMLQEINSISDRIRCNRIRLYSA